MDIIVFAVIVSLLFGMAALNRRFQLIGLVAGIGLIMVSLLVYTGNIQVQTGTIENVRTDLNLTNITAVYSNITDVMGGQPWILTVISLIFGACGLLIFIGTIYSMQVM